MMTTWIDSYRKASKPQQLLALLFSLLAIFGLASSCFILLTPALDLYEFVVEVFQLHSFESRLKNYFPPSKLHFLGLLLLLASFSMIVILLVFPRFLLSGFSFLIDEYRFLKQAPIRLVKWMRTLPKWEKLSFAAIVVFLAIKGVYYICIFDLQYDEAWTYHQFIHRGPLFCIAAPHNNHPIYSIASSLLGYLPISLKWQIRFPVLLAGLCATLLLYPLLRQRFSGLASIVGLAFFAASPAVTFYMMFGRGYMFGIFGLITLILLLQRTEQKKQGILTASILTLYALPSMFLPWLVVVFEPLIQRRTNLPVLVSSFLFATLLYVPVLLSGASKEFVDGSQSFTFTPNIAYDYFLKLGHFLNGEPFLFLIFITLAIWYFINQKEATPFMLLFIPICISLLGNNTIPERVWSFLCVPEAILLGFLAQRIISSAIWQNNLAIKMTSTFGTITCFIFQLRISDQHDFLRWSERLDHLCEAAVSQLNPIPQKDTYIFNNFYYIQPLIHAHYAKENAKRCFSVMGMKSSKDFQAFDSKGHYDFVIADSEYPTKTVWLVEHDTLVWNEYFGLLKRK